MKAISLGNQSFSEIRRNGDFYVDKTSFLTEWYHHRNQVTLITRPRRFGKTLNLDMARCFFSTEYTDQKNLFAGLDVEKDSEMMELQGTIPVIFLSFSSQNPVSFYDFVLMFSLRVAQAFSPHRYLLESSVLSEGEKKLFSTFVNGPIDKPEQYKNGVETEEYKKWLFYLRYSVFYLSEWLSRYHGKSVYIFLDEYDTPLQSAYFYGFWKEAIEMMRNFFGNTFKVNDFLDRAILTGITRIAKESLFSEMNNLTVSSILSNLYCDSFGFTEREVNNALEEYHVSELAESVKLWYDGFTFGNKQNIYNPWSICSFLNTNPHQLAPYWAQSGSMQLADKLIRQGSSSLNENIRKLLLGESITCFISEELIYPTLQSDEAAVWSLLLAAGYLRPAEPEIFSNVNFSGPELEIELCTTNRETKGALRQMAKGWLLSENNPSVKDFLEALRRDDVESLNSRLQDIVGACSSVFDLGQKPGKDEKQAPEKYFQGLMTGLVAWLLEEYEIISQGESGDGRYDLTLSARKFRHGILMEFKVFDPRIDNTIEDTAKRARQQIEDRRYDARFLAAGMTEGEIAKYGIGFKGKKVLAVT